MSKVSDALLSVVTLNELASALRSSISYARTMVLKHSVAYRQTSGKLWLIDIDDAVRRLPPLLATDLARWYDDFLKVYKENETEESK